MNDGLDEIPVVFGKLVDRIGGASIIIGRVV
jgi:hypothetical protein